MLILILICSLFNITCQCTLKLPNNVLTITGLSTPFILSKDCSVLNVESTIFSEAVIVDIDTREFYIYYPTIVNRVSQVLNTTSILTLPQNHVIGIWFSSKQVFNLTTTLSVCKSYTSTNFAYCNIDNFYAVANTIKLPTNTCLTIRDYPARLFKGNFAMTKYFITTSLKITKDVSRSMSTIENTNSNDFILNYFILPALDCDPIFGKNLIDNSTSFSMILNQIKASQTGVETISTFIPDQLDIGKNNFWRVGLNQSLNNISSKDEQTLFCNKIYENIPLFMYNNYDKLDTFNSPVSSTATNLVNYLAYTYITNWNEYCVNLTSATNIIQVYYNDEGVVNGNNILSLYTREETTVWYTVSIIFGVIAGCLLITICCTIYYDIKGRKNIIEEQDLLDEEIMILQETINECVEDISNRERKIRDTVEKYMLGMSSLEYLNHLTEFERVEGELKKNKEKTKEKIKSRLESKKCSV